MRQGQGFYRQEAKKLMWAQCPKWPLCGHRDGSSALSVVSITCKDGSLEERWTVMSTWKNKAWSLSPPGVPTTLLVLALLFFAAAAGLAVCYVKRWGCWHMVSLVIFVTSTSWVYPRLLSTFPSSKWRWQSSYTVNVLPHLSCPPYHPTFPIISALVCYPAVRYRSMAVPLNIKK